MDMFPGYFPGYCSFRVTEDSCVTRARRPNENRRNYGWRTDAPRSYGAMSNWMHGSHKGRAMDGRFGAGLEEQREHMNWSTYECQRRRLTRFAGSWMGTESVDSMCKWESGYSEQAKVQRSRLIRVLIISIGETCMSARPLIAIVSWWPHIVLPFCTCCIVVVLLCIAELRDCRVGLLTTLALQSCVACYRLGADWSPVFSILCVLRYQRSLCFVRYSS